MIHDEFAVELPEVPPSFNVAPSQRMPVVTWDESGPGARLMRWGLIPFWDRSEKPKIMPINARSEDAMKKPMFRGAIQSRRCLVPATGFFEWKKLDPKTKQPHAIGLAGGRPFCFAGIHEPPNACHPATFLILTTKPNALMAEIHDRMPVLLTGKALHEWLEPGAMNEDRFSRVTTPHPASEMVANPVRSLVGNPRNNGPEIMQRPDIMEFH